MQFRYTKCAFFWLFVALLSSCATQPPQPKDPRSPHIKDGYPSAELDVSHIPDAVPKVEVRTRAGNANPYTVLGRTYHLVEDTAGFRQRGYASWYGTKFHGLTTANGEIYNMYGMTAAHKTLPIPSYVRVTNLDNGKSVVVRVNDRGPFHGDRIIDLTYTAAKKLGFVAQGTAPVEVEYLEPAAEPVKQVAQLPQAPAAEPVTEADYTVARSAFLQVGAFSSETKARDFQQQLAGLTSYPVVIKTVELDNLFRVQIGPVPNNLDLVNLRQKLIDGNYAQPHVVYE